MKDACHGIVHVERELLYIPLHSVDIVVNGTWPIWIGAYQIVWTSPKEWKWRSLEAFDWQPPGSVINQTDHECGFMNSDKTWTSSSTCDVTPLYAYVCESELHGEWFEIRLT